MADRWPGFLPSSIARTGSAATVCAPDAKRQTSRDPQERSESDRASIRPSFRTRPREQSHTNHTDRFRPFSGTVRPLCLRAVPSWYEIAAHRRSRPEFTCGPRPHTRHRVAFSAKRISRH